MRFMVLRPRIRLTGQMAGVSVIAMLAVGCSSDFSRFDTDQYATASPQAAPTSASNPYPGDLDATTTASVGANGYPRGPVPAADVRARPILSGGNVAPGVGAPQALGPQPVAPQSYAAQPQPVASTQQSYPYTTSQPGTDPLGTETAHAHSGVYGSNVTRQSLPPAGTDPLTTAALPAGASPVNGAPSGKGGWSAAGGTTIELRQGETIYNLSKRYGVPAPAIMEANGITDPSTVQAGQRIVIPTFVYSRNAPVSAPDANPGTRLARASLGSSVAPASGAVPIPSRKPTVAASVRPAEPEVDRSIVTGSVRSSASDAYTVVSGDTLSSIARRHDTNVSALMAANALSGPDLRVGQTLSLPAGSAPRQVASAELPANVDPIITGTVRPEKPEPYIRPTPAQPAAKTEPEAPSSTGIGQFRWPVRGRVITGFGEKAGSTVNDGIDISVPEGTAVKAVENGVVVYAGNELEGFGNLVLLRHADGWVSAYAHNKMIDVERGQEVRRGEIIARSGRTGDAEMPKLHFELRKNSKPVDPLKHLSGV